METREQRAQDTVQVGMKQNLLLKHGGLQGELSGETRGADGLHASNTRSPLTLKYAPLDPSARLVSAPPTKHSIHPHALARRVIPSTNRERRRRLCWTHGVVARVVVGELLADSFRPFLPVFLSWIRRFSEAPLRPYRGKCARCLQMLWGENCEETGLCSYCLLLREVRTLMKSERGTLI